MSKQTNERPFAMSRRTFLRSVAIGAATISASVLAACGTAAPVSPTAAPAADPAAPTTVPDAEAPAAPTVAPAQPSGEVARIRSLMWSTGPVLDENFKKRAEMFNAAHAGRYEVDLQILPWEQYWPKVDLGYASKQPFDVYAWDVQAYGHYKAGLLHNLQEDVNSIPTLNDKDEYPLDLLDVWRFDGSNLYAMPDNLQMLALYYNKDMFDKAGLSYPDESWDWDKMLEVARAMTIAEGDTFSQWGMDVGDLTAWWGTQTLAWAMGGQFFDKIVEPTKFTVSDPASVQAITFVQDLMYKEKLAPDNIQRQAVAQDMNIFLTGKVGMYPGGTWFISSAKDAPFKWDIAPMPKWKDKRALAFWFGGWVVAKESKHADAAAAYATWSATEYQKTLAETKDWIPIRREARESATMQEGMPSGFQSVMQTLPDARLGDLYHRNSQQIISEVLFPTFDLIWSNKLTPEEAAKQIDEKANELLNKA